MKMKPYHRLILQEAHRQAVDDAYYVTGRGPHPKLIVHVNARSAQIPVAGTPSDVRSIRNAKAQLRRLIKALKDAA